MKSEVISAGEINLVRTFETWNAGIIKSTDPAGIVYHPPSGHLFIADSEIDEIDAIWNCENIFEVNLNGDQVFNTFDSFVNNPINLACIGDSANDSRDREPTGITYNEFDNFFYITNDDRTRIMRYNETFGEAIAAKFVQGADFEGITSDPSTGFLYVVSGEGQDEVKVYSSELEFMYHFSVSGIASDPEGIAYNSKLNHLFILSDIDKKIYEFTLDGNLLTNYDISNFIPMPKDPQGLTFAPSSDPDDDPANFNLYIVDGQNDNDPFPLNDRDGLIYEAMIEPISALAEEMVSIPFGFSLSQNYPNPFNPETQIKFQLPLATQVIIKIYNIIGQEILNLVDMNYSAGMHTVHWNGTDNYGNLVPSGIYFYRLQAGNFYQVKKMSLLK